jgi:hypothetical protein
MKRYLWAGLIALFSATATAWANPVGPDAGLSEREYRLEQRIEHGWRTGELTRPEYRRLRFELTDIERADRYYRSNGFLSPREVRELHVRLDALSRQVFRETRDVERRYGYAPYNYDYRADRRF